MSDRAVLFVDLLGFSQLVKDFPDGGAKIRPFTSGGDHDRVHDEFWLEDKHTARRIVDFHRLIDAELVSITRRLYSPQDVVVMTFSDSAMMLFETFYEAAFSARRLMRACLARSIPVRMGLAVGGARVVRIQSLAVEKAQINTAQFYGTAIVWASEAEHSRRGLRIFVHPSAEGHMEKIIDRHFMVLPLPPEEQSEASLWEVDYLYHNYSDWWYKLPLTHWDKMPDETIRDNVVGLYATETKRCEPKPVHPNVVEHYENTFEAVNRMRQALKRDTFSFS